MIWLGVIGSVEAATVVDDAALERWSRQIVVPGVDIEGQERLAASSVVLVGCGGLGCPLGLYLAAAGVGALRLVDADTVELSNLPRQVAFSEADLGKPKAEVLAAAATARNRQCEVAADVCALTEDNAEQLLSGADLVIDATDSTLARRCIDLATRRLGVPWILGAVVQQSGFWVAFSAERGEGCYHCLAPEVVAGGGSCAELGILGPVAGAIAMGQCTAALHYLSGCQQPDWGVLHLLDLRNTELHRLTLVPRPGCDCCTA